MALTPELLCAIGHFHPLLPATKTIEGHLSSDRPRSFIPLLNRLIR